MILFACVGQMKAALELKVAIYNLKFTKIIEQNLTVTEGSFQLVDDLIIKGSCS